MIDYININGVGNVHYSLGAEYVPGEVSTVYIESLGAIQAVLNTLNPNQTTNQDYDKLANAIANLSNLATSGVSAASHPTAKFYMTQEMAQNLQNVVAALQAANIPVPLPSGLTDAEKNALIVQYSNSWSNIKGYGINNILTNAENVYLDPRSLQSMIELEYVKAGNEQLLRNLSSLEAALSANQRSLNALTSIQNVANQIAVQATGPFRFPPATIGDLGSTVAKKLFNTLEITPGNQPLRSAYWKDFEAAGGIVVDAPVIPAVYTQTAPLLGGYLTISDWARIGYVADSNGPIFVQGKGWLTKAQVSQPSGTIGSSFNIDLFNSQTRFATLLNTQANANTLNFQKYYQIAASAHFTQQGVIATAQSSDAAQLLAAKIALLQNLSAMESSPNERNVPNTLPNFLYRVCQDISAAIAQNGGNVLSGTKQWIIDNQNTRLSDGKGSGGTNQNNVAQAITASESLNESQKQNVQKAMFLFQQYEKSASDVLKSVNDLITRMAQTIKS
jgi:hypothetical protein